MQAVAGIDFVNLSGSPVVLSNATQSYTLPNGSTSADGVAQAAYNAHLPAGVVSVDLTGIADAEVLLSAGSAVVKPTMSELALATVGLCFAGIVGAVGWWFSMVRNVGRTVVETS